MIGVRSPRGAKVVSLGAECEGSQCGACASLALDRDNSGTIEARDVRISAEQLMANRWQKPWGIWGAVGKRRPRSL